MIDVMIHTIIIPNMKLKFNISTIEENNKNAKIHIKPIKIQNLRNTHNAKHKYPFI